MDLLKFSTAGSVDDGKSTLIGRLLYDTKSLTDDKIEAIERISKRNGFDYLDFSLATDGLVAEREQGITIDVAHIYFSTRKRSFVIADTPGHVEYTRNMVTGASDSWLSVILIDARKGIIEQTYRHFFINHLLRMKHVVVAVNKIDLMGYSQEVFDTIVNDFKILAERSGFPLERIDFVPISALWGDNVVNASDKTPWYKGETLLHYLETVQTDHEDSNTEARFRVQYVIRPKSEAFHDYRGYAGKLTSGVLRVGDSVTVLPSGQASTITNIHNYTDKYTEIEAGESVSIELADNVNISRGDLIVKTAEVPAAQNQIRATICWADAKKLAVGTKLTLQHGVTKMPAIVQEIQEVHHTDFSGSETGKTELVMNEIGTVVLRTARDLYADKYEQNRGNGSFILIDPLSHNTSAVGFVR
ncbi:MAG: hypothetical protein RIS47_22 [Bacteroidota bacterium]|jgi:sulfate adenylyltransferase subunit 1